MAGVKICFVLFVLIATFAEFSQCGRSGGSRGGSRSSSSSRGSYHAPSYHAPSYHAPSPSYHFPSPSYHVPAPSYHPSPSYHVPSPSYSVPSYHHPSYRPSATSRPRPPAYERPAHAVTARPNQSNRPGISTGRPNVYTARTSSRPHFGTTPRPVGPSSGTRNIGTTRRPIGHGTTPRRHFTTARPVGFGNLPPAPGRSPVGPPRYHSPSGSSYGSGYSGPQKVKIVNKYNYHYPGYYSVPMAHNYYPGYFYTPSYYHYSTHDTGSTALGFYLGYGLARLTTPTYSHYSFYDGYRPRYDHYTVHHYYHNRDSVPQSQEIRANTIIGCIGDAAQICPANTTSLCTSDGALMCVASAISTRPCSDNKQINCVTSTISCVNNTAPECKNSIQNTTTISIPCVSKAEVYGDLKTVNNTIIPANATLVPAPTNTTNVNATGTNSTATGTNSTATGVNSTATGVNSTATGTNSTATGTNSTSATNVAATNETFVTQYTQVPLIETTTVPHIRRKRRDAAENYCVTILALPAKRQPTQGEEFLKDAKFITNEFLESIWGL